MKPRILFTLLLILPFIFAFQCGPRTPFDFDDDNMTDLSIFRPSSGQWWIRNSAGVRAVQWGLPTDKIVPANYTMDAKTDIAVFRSGDWYVLRSEDSTLWGRHFGMEGDIPVPANYYGDPFNSVQLAVYRPSEGTWYVAKSAGGVFGSGGPRAMQLSARLTF